MRDVVLHRVLSRGCVVGSCWAVFDHITTTKVVLSEHKFSFRCCLYSASDSTSFPVSTPDVMDQM